MSKANQSDNLYIFRYLRLPVKEVTGLIVDSSTERHNVFSKFGSPTSKSDIIQMLGDQSSKTHTVFRDAGIVRTVAMGTNLLYSKIAFLRKGFFFYSKICFTGIFDCKKLTWSLYSDNPKNNEPMAVLPLVLKS